MRGDLSTATEPLAEARAAFLHVPLEHFLLTPEGRAAADAGGADSPITDPQARGESGR